VKYPSKIGQPGGTCEPRSERGARASAPAQPVPVRARRRRPGVAVGLDDHVPAEVDRARRGHRRDRRRGDHGPTRLVIGDHLTVADAEHALTDAGVNAAPVVDADGRFEGTVTAENLRSAVNEPTIRGLIDAGAPVVTDTSRLNEAIEALTAAGRTAFVPVLDTERHVKGTLSISDIVRAYRTALLANLQPGLGAMAGELDAAPDSPLAGTRLRDAALPPGIIVTTIQRGPDTITPTGDTTIQAGDRLTILDHTPEPPD
jgi:CBS domain-containing protein